MKEISSGTNIHNIYNEQLISVNHAIREQEGSKLLHEVPYLQSIFPGGLGYSAMVVPGNEILLNKYTTSSASEEEVHVLLEILSALQDHVHKFPSFNANDGRMPVGIITPYKLPQKLISIAIEKRLKDKRLKKWETPWFQVGTVEVHEGREYDIVFSLLTRGNPLDTYVSTVHQKTVFLAKPNRSNVIVHRPRYGHCLLYTSDAADD